MAVIIVEFVPVATNPFVIRTYVDSAARLLRENSAGTDCGPLHKMKSSCYRLQLPNRPGFKLTHEP